MVDGAWKLELYYSIVLFDLFEFILNSIIKDLVKDLVIKGLFLEVLLV